MKLVVHRCHVNKLNAYNQVGLIAVNCLGVSTTVAGNIPVESYHNPTHRHPGGPPPGGGGEGGGGGGTGGRKAFSDPHISKRLAALDEVKIRKATAEEFDDAAR